MKTKLFFSSLILVLLITCGIKAQAQSSPAIFNDTILIFKTPGKIFSQDPVLKGNNTFELAPAALKSAKPVSASLTKSMMLPKGVKRLPSPIKVRRNGKCYRIGCDKSDCDNCQLFWYDKNKDGKVQPRMELRCYCVKGKKRCKMRGKQVPCKK